jgi:hypothetical protein
VQQPTPHFDKALLQPTRLAVVAHLVACGGEASFAQVRAAARGPSHSLLWVHTEVLTDAGFIEVRKHIVGRQVSTTLILTKLGRHAFAALAASVAQP